MQKLNATLMRTTGGIHNTIGGSFDSSRGEFRLCGVTAGVGGRSYMGYQKVSLLPVAGAAKECGNIS